MDRSEVRRLKSISVLDTELSEYSNTASIFFTFLDTKFSASNSKKPDFVSKLVMEQAFFLGSCISSQHGPFASVELFFESE